jgi:hypothetical protein
MRAAARWMLAGVTAVHGLIHGLGAAKGLGWAEVAQLRQPIGTGMGAVWFATAILVVAAGVMIAAKHRRWWIAAAVAALMSQLVIVTSWSDASAGTVANALLLLAAGHGFAAHGPSSCRAEYGRRVAAALGESAVDGVVMEADLDRLPGPVVVCVWESCAVGNPRIAAFRASIHGRIRAGTDKPWMAFTGEQVNTYGRQPSRMFFLDATMLGLPVDVLHVLVDGRASMRVKVCSVMTMVDAAGPEMDRAETVTAFNDLCILAPAALVDAPVTWEVLDGRRVAGTFTSGEHAVSAVLVFNEHHELVDFVSDDRLAASPDGKRFTRRRWSTPVGDYRTVGSRRVATTGQGCWHPEEGQPFAYLEMTLDDITYHAGTAQAATGSPALSSS